MAIPQKSYTGPAVPTAYEASWQTYTNLTQPQIAAFQAFPADLVKYASFKRWAKEVSPLTISDNANATVNGVVLDMGSESQRYMSDAKQAFDNGTLTGSISFNAKDGAHTFNAADIASIYAAKTERIQETRTALGTLVVGINAAPPTITSRAQIDAAFAVLP